MSVGHHWEAWLCFLCLLLHAPSHLPSHMSCWHAACGLGGGMTDRPPPPLAPRPQVITPAPSYHPRHLQTTSPIHGRTTSPQMAFPCPFPSSELATQVLWEHGRSRTRGGGGGARPEKNQNARPRPSPAACVCTCIVIRSPTVKVESSSCTQSGAEGGGGGCGGAGCCGAACVHNWTGRCHTACAGLLLVGWPLGWVSGSGFSGTA